MPLEVRQMIVKTNIVHQPAPDQSTTQQARPLAAPEMREVLEACRRLVTEMLQERRER